MKSKEELYTLKQKCESLINKLKELSEDELGYVIGGNYVGVGTGHACDIECNLNPDTCSAKKTTGHCPKEGI